MTDIKIGDHVTWTYHSGQYRYERWGDVVGLIERPFNKFDGGKNWEFYKQYMAVLRESHGPYKEVFAPYTRQHQWPHVFVLSEGKLYRPVVSKLRKVCPQCHGKGIVTRPHIVGVVDNNYECPRCLRDESR